MFEEEEPSLLPPRLYRLNRSGISRLSFVILGLRRARSSGNKIIGKGRLPTNNRVTSALKRPAPTDERHLSWGAVPSIEKQAGRSHRIKAMAAKLPRLVYCHAALRDVYIDQGAAFYDAQHRKPQIKYLNSKAAKLGSKSSKLRQPKGEILERNSDAESS